MAVLSGGVVGNDEPLETMALRSALTKSRQLAGGDPGVVALTTGNPVVNELKLWFQDPRRPGNARRTGTGPAHCGDLQPRARAEVGTTDGERNGLAVDEILSGSRVDIQREVGVVVVVGPRIGPSNADVAGKPSQRDHQPTGKSQHDEEPTAARNLVAGSSADTTLAGGIAGGAVPWSSPVRARCHVSCLVSVMQL